MTAAFRAWGLGRVVLGIGAAVLLIETTATDQLTIPPFSFALNGWSFVPPLVGVVMAEPLVDRSRQLTEHATRSPAVIAAARLGLAGAGAGGVAGYCLWSPDGLVVAGYVVAALCLAALAVAVADSWYWVPVISISFGWLQLTHGSFPTSTPAMPAPVLAALTAGASLCYVAGAVSRAGPAGRRRPG